MRAYREKPNGSDTPKGTAQALYYLQAQAASCWWQGNTDINSLHSYCARKRHFEFHRNDTYSLRHRRIGGQQRACLGRALSVASKIANPVHSFTEASYESSALGIGLGPHSTVLCGRCVCGVGVPERGWRRQG